MKKIALLGVLCLALASAAFAAPRYQLTNVGEFATAQNSYAYGMNSLGQVVGEFVTKTTYHDHAFVWTPTTQNGTVGVATDLFSSLGGSDNVAKGINDLGQVVGTVYNNSIYNRYAYRYDLGAGAKTNLGQLAGASMSDALAINNSGLVVGMSYTGATTVHAFYWNGTIHDIGTLSPSDNFSEATAVNDAGRIAGDSNNKPFIWDGTEHYLGNLGNGVGAWTMGMNGSGQIVGRTDNHAFLWTPGASNGVTGTMADLTPGFAGQSTAYDINDSGTVVGSGPYWFVYMDNTLYDINTLLDSSAAGWTIASLAGINNQGQIIANAYSPNNGPTRAVLLTPMVPEPSSLLALLSGAVGLCGLIAKRRQ